MSRWLRRLWSGREAKAPGGQEEATEKRRWSFWRPRECLPSAARRNPAPAFWAKRSSDEDEQSHRAVAVAAEGLPADGRGTTLCAAAVVIQTAFRGFLARKALKALKALIKLQALVRGHLIRKQAVTTLRRMEALARAQATTIRARRSLERLSSSFDSSSKIVEMDLNAYHARRSPALGLTDDSQLLAFCSPVPRRIAIPNRKNYHQENDCECWYAENAKGRLPATAHNTPKYMNVYGNGGGFVRAKSVASSPKFMASTQSSMAKRWSCQGRIEESRRRQPLSEVNSCCHVEEEGFSFKSVVVGRLERPSSEHLVKKN
ncbi:protein IQ-domain 26-like isoform X1 [Zingiber officinale]|uniref:protein IQ-domain 26-like isoform X1 n=1 Tax=Zingiber officinale TaxID=94328 RepID=UPI001C4DB9B6|nr:protein IQ-domain 26-like isoform X1 [Zingiber officinale]